MRTLFRETLSQRTRLLLAVGAIALISLVAADFTVYAVPARPTSTGRPTPPWPCRPDPSAHATARPVHGEGHG